MWHRVEILKVSAFDKRHNQEDRKTLDLPSSHSVKVVIVHN